MRLNLVFLLLGMMLLFSFGFDCNVAFCAVETPLIKTKWGQEGLYASKSPVIRGSHVRLGCWSTAIGQIINFHRLESFGKVRYTCSNGIVIENDLDTRTYNWNRMAAALTSQSSKEEVDEVSAFLYDVATVIQKDFDTDNYVLSSTNRAVALQQHFSCKSKLVSMKNMGEGMKDYITEELDSGRPCMLYIQNAEKTTGHAVVIDGWKRDGSSFLVHLNMGWEGKDDGWYDFDKPINIFNDVSYRLILSIEPTTSFQSTVTTLFGSTSSQQERSLLTTTNFLTTTTTNPPVTRTTTTEPQKKCIIATVAYGSELAPEVQFLRSFRDDVVMSTESGRAFMNVFNAFYYSFSPQAASVISENQLLRDTVKASLDPLIKALSASARVQSVLAINPELATITAGLVASALIGLVYLFPPMLLISALMPRRLQCRREVV